MATKLPPVCRSSGISTNAYPDSSYGALVPYSNKGLTENPSYTLQHSTQKYKLPQPKTLRPYVDSISGVLDTWPAHAGGAGQTTTHAGGIKSAPKPKFLEKLEGFLQKELRALDCTDPNYPSERRLQAFREVFECLIDDFRTYRPILSAIKNEYELMIVSQREKIRELEPFKSSLVTISEQCEQRVVAMKQEERGEVAELKKENDKLRQTIIKMRSEQTSLSEQVKKLQADISEEYKRYRDECDARKLLIQDLNDLKYQNEDGRRTSMTITDDEGDSASNEDGTLLRIALRKAREDLEAKTMQLAEVLADYGDVVPRRDYEKLEYDYKNIQQETSTMKEDCDTLMKDHSALIEVHKRVLEQRDQYFSDCEQLRRSGTPRPSWSKCGKYIEGGPERWDAISRDKSSEYLVDVLLSEITGQDIAIIQAGAGSEVEYFEGLGIGQEVPAPLRWEGKIQNRRISKRDTLLLIRDIWNSRLSELKLSSQENDDKKEEEFPDFVSRYMKGRYGSEELAAEWAYNLHDACQRYIHDSKVEVFGGIFTGKLEEEVYHDIIAVYDDLAAAFATEDKASKGVISKSDLKRILLEYFPKKNKEAIESLVSAGESENKAQDDGINYVSLLSETDDGQQGVFMSRISEQMQSEKLFVIKQMEELLQGKGLISPADAKETFKAVLTDINDTKCLKYISKGFGVSQDKLKPTLQIELAIFIAYLKGGSLSL